MALSLPRVTSRAFALLTLLLLPCFSGAAELQTLRVEGTDRHYLLRANPDVLQAPRRVPLVIVLHGGGGNALLTERMTGFSDKAEKEGFVVVYPEGSSRFGGPYLTWNAGHCCGHAMEQKIDDVRFISMLIDHLVSTLPVEPRQVYVTGMSNGGMMAHRVGRELSGKIAAIAPVVATVFGDEVKPANSVPALMINGALDHSVPYLGGKPGGRFSSAWDGTPTRPALEQATFWAAANGCEQSPDHRDVGAVSTWRYRCPVTASVELILLSDQGHAWPGGQRGSSRGDMPTAVFNATDSIWTFFKRFSRPLAAR